MIDQKNKYITIIGAGCSGLTLCLNLVKNKYKNISLIDPILNFSKNNHIWGFWKTNFLDDAINISSKNWEFWKFENKNKCVILKSKKFPYYAIYSRDWLEYCFSKSKKSINIIKSKFSKKKHFKTRSLYFDSRTPKVKSNTFLQHFYGIEVHTNKSVFDPKIATLMDFRVDQTKGIHFIYILPFTKNRALVTSTMFSNKIKKKNWYLQQIKNYLSRNFQINSFVTLRNEFGVIPMESIKGSQYGLPGIGTNGNAVRISSGYAFAFIQKQVNLIVNKIKNNVNEQLNVPIPHKSIDLFLDRIFIDVLKTYPEKAPDIFICLVSNINGDEMAEFMSGHASIKTYLKIIYAMPKIIFVVSFLKIFLKRKN